MVSGVDRALNGVNITGQYASSVSSAVYGSKCTTDLVGTTGSCFWLDRAAFAAPALGTKGNLRPGTVFGPGNLTFNAGLAREFRIRERQTLEVRAEGQNVLNRTNFNNPSGDLNNANFGRIQTSGEARVMQFAVKYLF